jgi:hypothetical protein
MSSDLSSLAPALVAAGGGSGMLAGVWAYERRRDEAMRASRVRLGLRFPLGLEPVRAYAALDGLSGLPHTGELIFEVTGREGSIAHALWVPAAVRTSVISTMTGIIPSLRVADADTLTVSDGVTLALKLFVQTPSILSGEIAAESSRSLLAGLAVLRLGEDVVIRWALRPGQARRWQAPADAGQRQREIERAWQHKTAQPGFRVAGLVVVRAKTIGRARELAGHVESVLRSRRSLVGGIRITVGRGNRSLASLPHVTRTSGWLSSAELLGLLAWPLGSEVIPGVVMGGRELAASAHLPRSGRRLFIGRDHDGERWVALDPAAARLHTVVAGSSGSGKSEMLARGILDEIASGHTAGAVIDPKADLIQTVLDRIPARYAERVVVLDPGDDARLTPGVDVLRGGDPDLRTDVLIGALKNIFSDWGIRSETYGRLAIRSLCEMPGATLADTGRLFTSEPFLRSVIARLQDSYLIEAWKQYLALPAGSKIEHVQAPMARVSALLARPRVRSVLASPEPKLDVARLFEQRKWILVSLAPGTLGEAGATIVGAALTHLVWAAIEARVALAPERRHLISVYLDEMATLTGGVPFSFELLAERARGLGAALTVAVQTLGRIPEPTRSALLGNSGNFISFRAPAEEAARIARQLPGLSEADVMALERFHVAARLTTSGAVTAVTGRTLALPVPTGEAAAIRDASAREYAANPSPAEGETPSQKAKPDALESQLGRTGRAS